MEASSGNPTHRLGPCVCNHRLHTVSAPLRQQPEAARWDRQEAPLLPGTSGKPTTDSREGDPGCTCGALLWSPALSPASRAAGGQRADPTL